VAVGANAVVIATPGEIVALNLSDGRPLWRQPLPAAPVPWGLAIAFCPNLFSVLKQTEWSVLSGCFIFGAMWGVGGPWASM
jgi:hypothetical protein